MNLIDLTKQLKQNPNDWTIIQRTSITEKKPIKETNKYKSMLVKARYWNARPNLEARLTICEPLKGETYPRAMIEMRYIENATPAPEIHAISINHNPEITKLIENINDLLTEGDKLTRLATSILETLRNASSKQLSDMEARIHTARAIADLNLEAFKREDLYS